MHRHLVSAVAAVAVLFTLGQSVVQAQVPPVPETRFIPEKAIFGAVVRPNAILQNPEIQKLYKLAQAEPRALPEKDFGTEFSSIELAVFGLTIPDASPNAVMQNVPSLLVRTKDAAALKTLTAKAIRPELQKKTLPGTTTEAFVSPQPHFQPEYPRDRPPTQEELNKISEQEEAAAKSPDAWKISDTFVMPDDRTLLFSQHGEILVSSLNQMKPGAAVPAWAKSFDSPARFPVAAFVDLKQTREMIRAISGGKPPEGPNAMIFGMVSPLWEKADLAVVALDTGDGLKLTIVAHSPDADSAKALKGSIDGLLAMGKGMLPMVKAESSKLDMFKPGLGAQLYGDLEKAVSELSVTNNGTMTIVKFAIQQQTLATITATVVPLMEKAQAAARERAKLYNLKMIGLAMQNYQDSYRTLPTPARMKKDGQPPHSWRVAILPFIEEDALYRQYNFDEPWDSEANKKILAQMPAGLRAPDADPNSTNASYVVPIIDKGLFVAETVKKGPSLAAIADGTSNTIVVIETETSIPWTKPEDLVLDPAKPLPPLGFPKSPTLNVAFADGSVQRLIKNPTMELLLPFLTASGGDTGDMSKLLAPSPAGVNPQMPPAIETKSLPPATK